MSQPFDLENYFETAEFKPTAKNDSFSTLQEVEPVATAPKNLLIVRSNQIDAFSIKRTRVRLTPSMCTRAGCNFDAAEKWGGYANAPESERSLLRDVKAQHEQFAHNWSEEHIIDEEQLPDQWLGSDAKKKPIERGR